MRAFLAIELTDEIRATLGDTVEQLREMIPGRTSWVREENLHLSIRFLGEVKKKRIEAISTALETICERTSPCALTVTGVGVFPNPSKARVMWCGSEGDIEQLAAFQAECEQAAQSLGLTAETKPWKPHITLGRFRNSPSLIREGLDAFAELRAGELPVKGVTLFSSALTQRGPIYAPIRKFTFSCP